MTTPDELQGTAHDRTDEPGLLSVDQLWQALLGSTFDLVFTFDPAGVVLSVNRAAPGFRVDEMVGSPAYELVVPEQQEDARRAIRRVFEQCETVDIEVQDVRVRRWYACRLTPVLRAGKPIAAVVIAHDVTARKESEQALRAERDKARQYLAVAGVILVTLDARGCVTLVNQMGCDVLGFRTDEILGKNWFDHFVPERMRESVRTVFAEIVSGHRTDLPETYENPVVTWSGEERLISWRNTVLRDDHGHIVATLSSGEDITQRRLAEEKLQAAHDELERRVAERTLEWALANEQLREDIAIREQVEQELRESEEQFRAIADATPVPIMISRISDGRILYGNQRLEEVVGRPLTELMEMTTIDFYADPAERDAVVDEIRRAGYLRDREIRACLPNGSRAWLLLSARPIKYRGESAMLAGLLDITRRKAVEEQLRTDRRLLQRLLDLNERDRQLVAYEIHDGIVQDMTGALMFLEAALYHVPDQQRETTAGLDQGIRLIRDSIGEARRLIDGLRPTALDDAGIVAAVENLAKEMSQTANLSIEVEHDIQFDRIAPTLETAIYRIVQEGLNNVWQHSGSHEARVELVQQGETVRITVRDRGIGFDPRAVHKKRYGLAGVRERARLLGGAAKIESAPGAGTAVHVELPLTDVLLPEVEIEADEP